MMRLAPAFQKRLIHGVSEGKIRRPASDLFPIGRARVL